MGTDFLDTLPRFASEGRAAMSPDLDRMRTLLAAMEMPHEKFRSIHVAGTNGKGSTASFLAAILTAGGERTGLHTSPHLFSVHERMRIDGRPVPDSWLSAAVDRWQPAIEASGASYFEATLALSFRYFAESGVDRAVVETGLGGRLDATNVLDPELTIITPIARDHTGILGDTLAEIAREKAGIIKPDTALVISRQPAEALEVLTSTAQAQGASYQESDVAAVAELEIGLHGAFQRDNAAVAARAAEGLGIGQEPIRRGLRDVVSLSGLRGRLEICARRPYVIADAAHNYESLSAALEFSAGHNGEGSDRQLYVLFGLMRDRDPAEIAPLFRRYADGVYAAELPTLRAWPADELAGKLDANDVTLIGSGSPEAGYRQVRARLLANDVLLVTGSFQLLGALPELFHTPRVIGQQ